MKRIILSVLTVFTASCMGDVAFANIKWDVDGGVVSGYDDNVTYVHSNPIRDMVTRTSLEGGLTQESSNDQFDLKGGVTENIYTSHSSLDNLAENMDAEYKDDLNAYEHLTAKDIFTHSIDSSLENSFGRINGNYGTYYNKLNLDSTTDITEQWSGSVRYNQINYLFSTNSLSDSALYNPEISTKYDFSSQSQGMLNYDFRRRSFSPGKSSDANTPSAGWRQYLDPQWHVDLLSGVDFIKGFGRDLIKPRYAAGLTNDVDQNTQLSLTYDKQYESDQYTQDINNDWHVTLNGYRQFTSRLSGDVAVYTGQGKYVTSGITEKYIGTSITVKYAMSTHMDFSLNYNFQDSSSNTSIRSSTQNTIFGGIAFKY